MLWVSCYYRIILIIEVLLIEIEGEFNYLSPWDDFKSTWIPNYVTYSSKTHVRVTMHWFAPGDSYVNLLLLCRGGKTQTHYGAKKRPINFSELFGSPDDIHLQNIKQIRTCTFLSKKYWKPRSVVRGKMKMIILHDEHRAWETHLGWRNSQATHLYLGRVWKSETNTVTCTSIHRAEMLIIYV